jgi:hypothetical protein
MGAGRPRQGLRRWAMLVGIGALGVVFGHPTATVRAAGPTPAALASAARIGMGEAALTAALAAAGAAVWAGGHREAGALDRGLLDRPGLLAGLAAAGAPHRLLDGLPARGPRVVVARRDGVDAAYALLNDTLEAFALSLPAEAVAPRPAPFDPDRLRPLEDAIAAFCPGAPVAARDPRGSPRSWAGRCHGGRGRVAHHPETPEDALRLVVWRDR